MAIRTWDYRCKGCGTYYRDWPYEGAVPESIDCISCGGKATWTFMKRNHIHLSHSGRKYGQFDPQFGQVVEDYGHKKRLLREMGMEEVGPASRDQIMEETQPKDIGPRDPSVLAADSVDEIMGQIEQDRIDRRATGSLRGRRDQDEKTGLIESWVGL